ncbi:uncharacterized protein LOC124410834 isoform X2 [Diprion similis]|uniref:uncharacterized protein LOC124410834 isoform X2 n=1 Tax=Diprion similis TaxID=362088 RepID=UPI001EF8FA13|nr:uncharacterized protein LOC124410834 isoform X2 [Diprion similis]
MIGSFWNLCRACPSMPIDKLHSEYRSTYTWHEYTGPHQDQHTVVRRSPQPAPASTKQANAKLQSAKSTEDDSNEGPTLEPALPRRKKCPELAYKSHEFMTAADGSGMDSMDSNMFADKTQAATAAPELPTSQLSKAISRISTEYRLQFAWPRRSQLTNGEVCSSGGQAAAGGGGGSGIGTSVGTAAPPRKSLSMGALKQGIVPSAPAPVHKKRTNDVDRKRDGVQPSELEPLVGSNGIDVADGVVLEGEEHDEELVQPKVTFRGKKSGGKSVRIAERIEGKSSNPEVPNPTTNIAELRRLADEYKLRDWGRGLAAEEDLSLGKRVTSNHALDALTLARSVTKEEKEQENTRKIGPTQTTAMPPAGRASAVQVRPSSVQTRPVYSFLQDDTKMDNERAIARARKDFLIRHHLDRTTGVGDGALLPSPTREKLEPVMPRRRDESKDVREEIQPRVKSSPKNSPRAGRSQSLGPTATERRSPKRQPVRAPSLTKDSKEKSKEVKDKEKETSDRAVEPARHPRPTSLATNAPAHRPFHHAKPATAIKPPVKHSVHSSVTHPSASATAATVAAAAKLQERAKHSLNQAQVKLAGASAVQPTTAQPKSSSDSLRNASRAAIIRATSAEPEVNGDASNGESNVGSTATSAAAPPSAETSPWVDDEPLVKSPPEPTRVKSPEQMIMRSPEPVNWTVPLDTGKTFTVTQNVREGEPLTRPHSEAKTWGASSMPPIPQSASPDLVGHHKSQHSGYKSPESESVSLGSFSGLNGHKEHDSGRESPLRALGTDTTTTPTPMQQNFKCPAGEENEAPTVVSDERLDTAAVVKPVVGTNLRCLEDPVFEFERKKEAAVPPSGYRVLEAEAPHGGQSVPQANAGGSGGYHVLEAPAVLGQSTGQHSMTNDVLEKARNRFDKFWGKGSEN